MPTIEVKTNTTISSEDLAAALLKCGAEETAAVLYALFHKLSDSSALLEREKLGKACALTNRSAVGMLGKWMSDFSKEIYLHAEIDRRDLVRAVGDAAG